MRCELLVIDPRDSTSMLEPLSVLEVFMAAPYRWHPNLLDTSLDGIRVLPTSRLYPVLRTWTRERGLRLETATASEDWLTHVAAVLIFDTQSAASLGELFASMGVDVVYFDLEQGRFSTVDFIERTATLMAIQPPEEQPSAVRKTS